MDQLTPVEELSLVVARSAGAMMAPGTVEASLRLLVEVVLETVPGADACAVTVLDAAVRGSTSVAGDELAARADELQYAAGEGPCLEAVARRGRTLVDDARTDARWPRWAVGVGALGLRSVLSTPLVAGDAVLGAVKVYGRAPHAFDARSERLLALYAAQAAVLQAALRAAERGRHLSAELKGALRSRDVVNTARGILVERERVDERTALAVLAAQAEESGRPLHVVARSVVDAATRRRP